MEYLIGIIVALVGLLGYNFMKRRSAEALIENQEALAEFVVLDKKMAKNDGLNAAEAQRRAELKILLAIELANKGASNEEIADFFNNRYTNSK